jgi:hypothetical protein
LAGSDLVETLICSHGISVSFHETGEVRVKVIGLGRAIRGNGGTP